jgi:hypothetical protein
MNCNSLPQTGTIIGGYSVGGLGPTEHSNHREHRSGGIRVAAADAQTYYTKTNLIRASAISE